MSNAERKRQLAAEIARARSAMTRNVESLRASLDVATRVKSSIRSNPWPWLGAAAAVGGITWVLLRPRRALPPPSGLWENLTTKYGPARAVPVEQKVARGGAALAAVLALGRWVFPLVRPLLLSYLSQRAGSYFGGGEPATPRRPE